MRLPIHSRTRKRVVALLLGAALTILNVAVALADGGGSHTYPR